MRGRKKTLTESDKEIIRKGYEKGLGSKKILEQVKEQNINVKRHHIHQFAYLEGFTNGWKDRSIETRKDYFNCSQYFKSVVTI